MVVMDVSELVSYDSNNLLCLHLINQIILHDNLSSTSNPWHISIWVSSLFWRFLNVNILCLYTNITLHFKKSFF